jgi:hypothetical protein
LRQNQRQFQMLILSFLQLMIWSVVGIVALQVAYYFYRTYFLRQVENTAILCEHFVNFFDGLLWIVPFGQLY